MERSVGSLPGHKFTAHIVQGEESESMPEVLNHKSLGYMLEVFVDNHISLAILMP
jgi:hypothetical protein